MQYLMDINKVMSLDKVISLIYLYRFINLVINSLIITGDILTLYLSLLLNLCLYTLMSLKRTRLLIKMMSFLRSNLIYSIVLSRLDPSD
jgi:hypothetical protein